jgi:hypothetical protein
MSAIKDHAEMALDQIVARLFQLAEHRTPAAIDGIHKPPCPVPMNEFALLREAAARLQRMQVDIDNMQMSARNAKNWPHWAICDAAGKIMESTSKGREASRARLDSLRAERGKLVELWTCRPLSVGGVNMRDSSEIESAGAEHA